MNDQQIHFRLSTDNTHMMGYDSSIDGLTIEGYAGVKLYTATNGAYITCSGGVIDCNSRNIRNVSNPVNSMMQLI